MKGFDFTLHINDEGKHINKEVIEKILGAFFQFVTVRDLKKGEGE